MSIKHHIPVYSCLVVVMVITLYSLIPFSGTAYAWSGNPNVNTPICTAGNEQGRPTLISDGMGGAIITWEDYRYGNWDIYAQRVDASGARLLIGNGVPICTADNAQMKPQITSDGAGGAIITWEDYRNSTYCSDIYAQRIDATGKPQWTADGVAICTASLLQYNTTLISDGEGGAIITWVDSRNGIYDTDIYAQLIDASGNVKWTADGVAISTASKNQLYPTITTDGVGGAIITWEDDGSDNGNIYAQRIDARGIKWNADGVAICTAANDQGLPTLTTDGEGGAIISWEDGRGSSNDIYAQRISYYGGTQWTEDGVPICRATGSQQYPTITVDGSGGAIITWQDYRSPAATDIYAQRVSMTGYIQWTDDGVPICTAYSYQFSPKLISDGVGGAIITWCDFRRGSGNPDIYAQRIDASGNVKWTANGVAICTAGDSQFDPILTSDGARGAIITWKDYRNGSYSDIYAQRVYSNGTLRAVANPLFSPPPGTYTTPQSITLSCTTSSATIYYTTDGSAPTPSSFLYSAPIAISETTTVKARAYKSGLASSNTVTGLYRIVRPMPFIPLLLDE